MGTLRIETKDGVTVIDTEAPKEVVVESQSAEERQEDRATPKKPKAKRKR